MTGTATRGSTQSTAAREGFRQITGSTNASIFVRDKGENHPNSMKVLEKANLAPFTHQEILSILNTDETLKEYLKGKWFWLAGVGQHKEHPLYTIDTKGELAEIKGNVSIENTVRVWNGTNPLSLGVILDDTASLFKVRFVLDAYALPSCGALDGTCVVVGKAKPEQSTQQSAVKQAKQLLRV
jgi:hypothetical protein